MSDTVETVEFQPVEGDRPPEELVQQFVLQAAEMRASDLFFAARENSLVVQVRHLGLIHLLGTLSATDGRRCVSFIKAMSGIDIADRRRPQDGRWIFTRPDGSKLDLRVNTLPTLFGEDATLRLLDRQINLRTLDSLGLLRQQHDALQGMLNSPSGMILVTGPTSAGKTTTLYSCLNHLNNGQRKINTIEDPIEYAIEGLHQSQVNPALEIDFPDLLRSVLRQSPDVVMIGEVRDTVTAQTAIRAANSGHLVFATLHAPVAAAVLDSLFALGVPAHFISTCLRGVIAQRLCRTLCPECKVPIDLGDLPHTFEGLRPWLEPGQGDCIYAPGGCEHCHGTGYSGRRGLFEVMEVSKPIRHLIARRAPAHDVEALAIREGMLAIRQGGMLQVAAGNTTTEEILRVVPSEFLDLDA